METKRMNCDVLIVGGGIGGLTAAVSLKERSPETDILVVEKQTAGYSGKANRGGGVLQYFDLNRVKPIDFLGFHVNAIGSYLGDQELMLRYVEMNNEMMETLQGWGVNIPKKEDGSYNVMPTGPFTAMIRVDLDLTLKVRRRAEKLGVRFVDKTALAELLTDEGRIAGAACYSILDGSFTVISAKRVILATGSQNYRIGSMWSSGRGDGIAAAYRAGAKMRNTEFGNFAQLVRIRSHNEVVFGENVMYNSDGEFITPHFQSHRETDISSRAIREWYLQMKAGKTVHLDYGEQPVADGGGGGDGMDPMERMWSTPVGAEFRKLNDGSGAQVDTDMEVCPMFIGEQSPIYVGHDMQTSISGLYAIGDCSYCGSGSPGAVPAPPGRNRGSGILNAVFTGLVCAESVAALPAIEAGKICDEQVEKMKAELFAPLERKEGATAIDVIDLVQQAMAPVENSVVMQEDRILAAMKLVEKAEELSKTLCARDLHYLLSCREAEAMVLSAKMHFKASLMRKESRGWFLREDYPEMDNANWLKWIIVQNVDGEMTFSTEDVPIEKWPIQIPKA